jgi:hypothetical protein
MSHTPSDAHPDAQQHLTTQAIELSMAAPQVVAQRLTRMAMAGINPSQGDHDELMLMGSEKLLAFQQSWVAMWHQAWHAQVAMAESLTRGSLALASGNDAHDDHPAQWLMQMPTAAAKVLSAGLAPVHGQEMANARRLSATGA